MADKINFLYLTSFRYCLGRMTYIVGEFHDNIKEDIRLLNDNTLNIISKEIDVAESLGMDCDKAYWIKVLRLIKDEKNRRK